jgi:hypothetical protein
LACVAALSIIAAGVLAPAGWTASTHRFSATYSGTGRGSRSGTTASGSATLAGHGKPIGQSTLTGSGRGTFTSETCLVFDGRVTLKGLRGSIRFTTHRATACVSGTNANRVVFSGRAKVVGGTSRFAHAAGTLSFSGSYAKSTRAVTISFKGRIRY